MSLLSAIKLWALHGSSAALRGYETACIDTWRTTLSSEAASMLDRQLEHLSFRQRLSGDKLLVFHAVKGGTIPADCLFPNKADELIAALVEVRADDDHPPITARIVLHGGKLSSLEFKKEPASVGLTRRGNVEIVGIKTIADPMKRSEGIKETRAAEATQPAWHGCLLRLSKLARIDAYFPPAAADAVKAAIGAHAGRLPGEYIEIIRQSDGVQVGGIKVLGASHLRAVVLPGHDLCVLAEIEGGNALCVDEAAATTRLVLLEDDNPVPVAQSFCDALAAALHKGSS
jgi:hypothetical protein